MKEINAKSADEMLSRGEAILVDVRENDEHKQMNIPIAELNSLSNLDIYKYADMDKAIIIHCQSGRRSAQACEKIAAMYPNKNVYSLTGGIQSWQESGLTIHKKGHGVSIIRQVMMITGILILFSIWASFKIHANYIYVGVFVGAGLLYAGVSGNCMMAILLSHCPWNRS